MSRIGKTPIVLPSQVKLEVKDGQVFVIGTKGTLNLSIPADLKVEVVANQIKIVTNQELTELKSIYGLFRSLLQNAVTGVSTGWQKTVELVGVGYKASGGGSELTLNVGFTHPVKIKAPKDVTFQIIENTKVIISGIDKKVVGEIAAIIRDVKPPEPYKGKGIRYLGEVVRKKAGKAVKAAGGVGA